MQRSLRFGSNQDEAASELDLGALGHVLKRHRRMILIPTVLAFLLVGLFVNVVTPRYTAESQVLLENQETFFTRPDRAATQSEQASLVDPEAVGSQVQLITSRDLARRAIKDLGLQGNPEFDPAARGMGLVARVLVLLGLSHDPTLDSADSRIVQAFLDKLTVFSPPKTRVITIQFQSKDPELAARTANKIADLYIAEQSSAKRIGAKEAADALSGQIADLRIKLAKADAEREQYRAQSGLLAGSNNMTVSGQQLADINGDLSRARATQADAQAKASMLRDLIRAGKTTDVTEVVNNDLVRRIGEQRVTAQAQLASESRTLLPGHPRIKELTAQVADLTSALKAAAKQAASTLENDAKVAGQRVANLETVLGQQKKVAGVANGDEVHLRSLDRISQSFKDQLDSSTTKYQEALARETSSATPADARVISRAGTPQDPSFPKKLPFILFGTVATFVFAVAFVVARELLSSPASVLDEDVVLAPVAAERESALMQRPRDAVFAAPRFEPAVEVAAPTPSPIRPAAVRPIAAADPQPEPPRTAASTLRQELGFETAPTPTSQNLPVTTVAKSGGLPWDWHGLVARAKAFGQSAAAARAAAGGHDPDPTSVVPATPMAAYDHEDGVGWDGNFTPAPTPVAPPRRPVSPPAPAVERPRDVLRTEQPIDIEALASRIVGAHVPGRGLHVVGASHGAGHGASDALLDLGRALAERGRAIIVDLNAGPKNLAALAGADGDGLRLITTLAGLSELLAGTASFAEVIHRDQASRLHFIPTGMRDADFRDFDLILDALSETYDFVMLLAPAFPHSDIARVMAPYADFVVLTASPNADPATLGALEADLIRAGAQEVLVAGTATAMRSGLTPHVA